MVGRKMTTNDNKYRRLAIQQSQTAIAIKGEARMPFYAISDWSAKKSLVSRLLSLVFLLSLQNRKS